MGSLSCVSVCRESWCVWSISELELWAIPDLLEFLEPC